MRRNWNQEETEATAKRIEVDTVSNGDVNVTVCGGHANNKENAIVIELEAESDQEAENESQKTSPTILQGRSATNVTRYFKCVLPCQTILHQGDLSFLRAKFMPNTSRSLTVSSPRTQTDDRTKACCKVLVGLWSVTIISPYHVLTI